MEELVPIVLFVMMFGVIGYITRIISDNRVRRELVGKDVGPDVIQMLFLENRAEDFNSNLKWGMVSVAIGVALGIIQFSELGDDEPLTFGIAFIAGGVALLAYYVMMKPEE